MQARQRRRRPAHDPRPGLTVQECNVVSPAAPHYLPATACEDTFAVELVEWATGHSAPKEAPEHDPAPPVQCRDVARNIARAAEYIQAVPIEGFVP